jgi:23S rRNA pseudouridine2604 synthase
VQPGQIAHMCQAVGLQVVALKRVRIGRVSMGKLPAGRWGYLLPNERF